MPKTENGFKVKKKYEGLAHPCSKNTLSTKACEANQSVGVEFYVEHPNGKKLFDEVPEGIKALAKKYSEDKAKADKEAAEAAKVAEAEKKTAEDLKQALADAEELGVKVTKADGSAKAISTLKKDIAAARKKVQAEAEKQVKTTEEADKKNDELAHKQPEAKKEGAEETEEESGEEE